MKYIKTYENIINKPNVGNYVMMKTSHPELVDFIANNIGKVININFTYDYEITVKYTNIPLELKKHFSLYKGDYCTRIFPISYVINFAKTKKELQQKLVTIKYNL